MVLQMMWQCSTYHWQTFLVWGRFTKLCVHCHHLESEVLGDLIEYCWGDEKVMGLNTIYVQSLQLLQQCSELFDDLACF